VPARMGKCLFLQMISNSIRNIAAPLQAID
jgi:hypothetical protein